jgi:Ca2+-binding EF-hand superfamily protein
VFNFFDKNSDGRINVDEFIVGMRGALNEARQPVVNAAFAKFDVDGTGYIDINDIKG